MQTLESICIPRGGYTAAKAKKGEYLTICLGGPLLPMSSNLVKYWFLNLTLIKPLDNRFTYWSTSWKLDKLGITNAYNGIEHVLSAGQMLLEQLYFIFPVMASSTCKLLPFLLRRLSASFCLTLVASFGD